VLERGLFPFVSLVSAARLRRRAFAFALRLAALLLPCGLFAAGLLVVPRVSLLLAVLAGGASAATVP
jgi:hypothetical protein